MRTIQTLDQPFERSKKTKALEDKLNRRAESHNAAWEKHEAEREKLKATEITPSNSRSIAEASSALGHEKLKLLAEEKIIREEIDSLYNDYERDMHAARTAAYEAHAAQETEVRAKLVEIGYVDGIIPGGDRLSITPGLIAAHPSVFGARRKKDAIESVSLYANRGLNTAALEELAAEIEKIRAELLGPAGR